VNLNIWSAGSYVGELEKTESEKNSFKLFLRLHFSFEANIFGQATLKGIN
jgi:hypothetical protein